MIYRVVSHAIRGLNPGSVLVGSGSRDLLEAKDEFQVGLDYNNSPESFNLTNMDHKVYHKRTMGKLSITLLIITGFLVLPITSSAQTTSSTPVSKSKCAKVKFHNLNRYKHAWSRVFQDREVASSLKILLKKDYRKLVENIRRASYPEDSLSFVDRNGVLTVRGFVPGLFTIMEGMLIVEPCGNMYVAILDDGDRFLYFSNDKEYVARLPPAIDEWRVSIEKARSTLEKKPELPVVFRSKP